MRGEPRRIARRENPRGAETCIGLNDWVAEALPSVESGSVRYRSIAAQLKRDIDAGLWKPGEQLPPEPDLATRFDVSQGTMRLAVLELVKARLLFRRQGKGTFVSSIELGNSFERFFRYEPVGGAKELPETVVLGQGVVPCDKEVAASLGIELGARVGWLRRVRKYVGEPFLLHDSYFRRDLWTTVRTKCDFALPDLYKQLQERCGTPILRADEYLSARLASKSESEALDIPVNAAVVALERHAYSFSDRKVEFRRSVGRGDRFSYHVKL